MSDLTNTQIVDIARRHNLRVNGIYLRNQIPSTPVEYGFTVFNLDHSHSGSVGTHWTCVYCTPADCIYFRFVRVSSVGRDCSIPCAPLWNISILQQRTARLLFWGLRRIRVGFWIVYATTRTKWTRNSGK